MTSTQSEISIIAFKTAHDWHAWLEKNHAVSQGVWVRFYKKASNQQTVSYKEAVEEALCYGWIDSQAKSYDDTSYLQKFTPRRAKSIWSKINTQHIERLIAEGKMHPAGMAHVEAAKKDGRWEKAYDSPSAATMPPEFLTALSKNKKAKAFFETLNKTNTYAIAWRLQTAKKPETKAKRMAAILEMLSRGEKFHE